MMRTMLLVGVAMGLSACSSVRYVGQAAGGQAEVMSKARPIAELLADPATPAELADKLKLAQTLRAFAVKELKLPDNSSYTQYADLGRPYALWNVVSTPALSLRPVESCFPVAGCLAYRGYYAEGDAANYAEQRRKLGEDVYLYGIPAYSTLGWFADPLLNTTIRYDNAALARLIFHELAHQVIYVRDDSAFNEAFATTVELEGYERWLSIRGEAAAMVAYRTAERRRTAFRQLMASGRARLETVYGGEGSEAEQQAAKAAILAEVAANYWLLKAEWGGYIGYDEWFAPVPNNAHFASVATYHDKVPALRALFRQQGSDFKAFYRAAQALAEKNRAARDASLAALTSAVVSGEKQRGATNSVDTP
ncbi:aminopeptidase [Chitinimonas arctica]|uniref:Aminopeptidase n=1 Tax=Chitinimonas arctica TaxID=2594795 RepID=A0A516SJV6_9NEIS|nr:aminopeptidase [Chitinimonas arctica]QDQ28424.1 aminopeptidase [Chitinimonas arctica]